jgi:hypothetical protein
VATDTVMICVFGAYLFAARKGSPRA